MKFGLFAMQNYQFQLTRLILIFLLFGWQLFNLTHDSFWCSWKICWILLSQNIWTKLMMMIAFALISLFHIWVQEAASRSITMKAFGFQSLLNFIITKYLKQVDDNLSICVDESSPCGLSITGDINIYQYHIVKV